MNPSTSIYAQSPTDGVWQRPDHGTFGYSDGDEVEDRIAAIMRDAQDRSVLSTELRASIRDWPTRYHLSPLRANILRPVESVLRGSVLEIGSGCGAITRYLGETARSVLALEGSRRRAHITRQRTRELSHVEVYCDEFSAFQTDRQFDAVTLIGVLEYAHMFVPGEDAALAMLRKTRERLHDNGSLVIAIENQLGLKYFAGAPEDHLGKPMVGVEDGYLPQGVRTYGRQALGDLLNRAGFESVECLYPFPDYKLPVSVLSDRGLDTAQFDPVPFLVLTAGKDPQLSDAMAFSLERAWPVMAANHLVGEHANSFLVVARKKVLDAGPEQKVLAWHFSTQRHPAYCKQTEFLVSSPDATVQVIRRPIASDRIDAPAAARVRHVLQDETPYAALPLLSSELIGLVTRPGWTDRQVADFLRKYARLVGQIGGVALVQDDQILWDQPLPGDLFDCIPQNIRLHPDGSGSVFDLEWRQNDPVLFESLAFRSLWHTVGSLSLMGMPKEASPPSLLDLILRCMRLAGRDLETSQVQDLVRDELNLQQQLTGESFDFEVIWRWMNEGTLRRRNVFQRLVDSEQQTAQCVQQVQEAQQAVDHWQQHADNLVKEIQHRDTSLADWQAHAGNLTASVQHWQEASSRHALERDEARNLLKTEQAASAGARQETLDSLRATHRLAQQLAHQILQRKSPGGVLRVARDHRSVVLRSRAGGAAPGAPVSWMPMVSGYLRTRHKLTALSPLTEPELLARWIQHACQWPLPFDWQLVTRDGALGHSMATLAARLEITAQVTSGETLADPPVRDWLRTLPPEAPVALPRWVRGAEPAVASSPRLPGPEDIRQAYSAIICDARLTGIYVGADTLLTGAQSAPGGDGFLCLFRAAHLSGLSAESTLWRPVVTPTELKAELGAYAAETAGSRSRILVV